MPKTAKIQTPGAVLQSYIEDYKINAFSLSKSIEVAYQSITNILKDKGRISTNIAMRLGQYFGNTPQYWLDIQSSSEIAVLSADKKFVKTLKSIPKVNKSKGKVKQGTVSRKKAAESAGRKKNAVKSKGLKKARGRKAGRPPKK